MFTEGEREGCTLLALKMEGNVPQEEWIGGLREREEPSAVVVV